MSSISKYWSAMHLPSRPVGKSVCTQCPRVECKDGFTMSVQASEFHYCTPREYLEAGEYAAWEIGFPSEKEDLIMGWVEDHSNPTNTVYGYVPTAVIDAVIEKHGGLADVLLSALEADHA